MEDYVRYEDGLVCGSRYRNGSCASANTLVSEDRFPARRHTYGKIALATLVPIHVVSERLGHMNSSVTLIVYSDVMPGMLAEAAQCIADCVTGSDDGEGAIPASARPTESDNT